MVKRRRKKNVKGEGLDFSKNTFLKAMLCCLATSQQRSGPTSKVANFLRIHPFPITEQYCRLNRRKLPELIQHQLSTAGIRLSGRIATFFTANLERLEDSNLQLLRELRKDKATGQTTEKWEREMATSISIGKGTPNLKLMGFGPKQARNLLQIMGVSRFEIPLDSRVLAWLQQYGFPYDLTDKQGLHPAMYEILVDSIKEIARRIGVYPCVLDAAIFAAVDDGGWTEDNLIF